MAGFQQLYIHRKLKFMPGSIVEGLPPVPGKGSVYYVNGGSDGPTDNGGSGTSAVDPKQTIAAALALCTSNYNDTIYVLNYGSNARAVETWPIVVDKDQVHIIGVGHKGNKWATVTATGSNKSAFRVTGHRVEIAGLEIGGTGSGAGVIIGAYGVSFCYIHDCWFGIMDGVGTNGVRTDSGMEAPGLRIEDCEFGKTLTGIGILLNASAHRGTIANNLFMMCPGCAIQDASASFRLRILDNRIYMDSNVSGRGIVLGANTVNCFIDGNHVASQKTATAEDAGFVDASALNAWGLNYSGIVADLPA